MAFIDALFDTGLFSLKISARRCVDGGIKNEDSHSGGGGGDTNISIETNLDR